MSFLKHFIFLWIRFRVYGDYPEELIAPEVTWFGWLIRCWKKTCLSEKKVFGLQFFFLRFKKKKIQKLCSSTIIGSAIWSSWPSLAFLLTNLYDGTALCKPNRKQRPRRKRDRWFWSCHLALHGSAADTQTARGVRVVLQKMSARHIGSRRDTNRFAAR